MGVKLSEIFYRYEKIKALDPELSKEKLMSFINDFNQQIDNLRFIESQELKSLEQDLMKSLAAYLDLTNKIHNKLYTTIASNHAEYLDINKKMWQTNLETMTFPEHLEWIKVWPPTDFEFKHFYTQVKQYNNWQYPGLVFGAKNSSLIKSFIGLEPIYIVERYKEYYDLLKEKFPHSFVRKIRFYNLDCIHLLPPDSIGVAAIFNEFNFLPWDIISVVLTKISKSIRPGGVIIFNYNNCDTARGFAEFENWSMTYTTPKMFIEFMSRFDFNLINNYTSSRETFSFMTFQKSGHAPLIKKSPSIGYIKQQPTFNTNQHQARLEQIARLIDAK